MRRTRPTRLRLAAVPLALGLLAACGQPAGPVASPCPATGLVSVGDPLPDCSFEGVGDHPGVSLASLRGQPAVINFWASWCNACIAEMPDFQDVYEDLGRAVHFLGMNTLGVRNETRTAAQTFAERTGARYPLAYDAGGQFYGHFGEIARPLLPLTIFADADGIVRYRNFGELSGATLRALIREHLDVG